MHYVALYFIYFIYMYTYMFRQWLHAICAHGGHLMKTSSISIDECSSKLPKSESATLFMHSREILTATVLMTLPEPINDESPDKYFATRMNIFVYLLVIYLYDY